MNINPPKWLHDAAINELFAAVNQHGGQLRIVGGVVRDLVRGEASDNWPDDIDAAVSLPPETMLQIATKLGIKAIPTGLAHGTITLLLSRGKFEVTTLRRDIATNGRHAQVAYTDRFEEDAARRDFTMNALYLAQDGTITDFHNGIADAKAGIVKFIGDPTLRITEDGLRILRYFRFLASHGNGTVNDAALAACQANISMLAQLSGERITQELAKLLAVKNPQTALQQMADCGVLTAILQGDANLSAHARLLQLERDYDAIIHPWLRLSVLLADHKIEVLELLLLRLRLSNEIKQLLLSLFTAAPLSEASTASEYKEIIRLHGGAYFRLLLLRSAALAAKPWNLRDAFTQAHNWQPPQFPLKGGDVIAYGVPQGQKVGEQLRKLEQIWAQSDYNLDKPSLLKKLKDTFSR